MAEDVTKLPKWAQTRIAVLEMRVAEWKAKALVRIGEGETNTVVDEYPERIPLPNFGSVRFTLANGATVTIGIRRSAPDRLNVNSSNGRLWTTPGATNDLDITVER